MRERGMIFNAEMVRAILDGRKTQTRRIMKVQPESNQFGVRRIVDSTTRGNIGKYYWAESNATGLSHTRSALFPCPFGQPGDRIYVRETWAVVSHEFSDDGLMVDYVPNRPAKAVHEGKFGRGYYSGHAIYAADGGFTWGDDDGCVDGRSCWKPSIHMPRWASRIALEITSVRVERLASISNDDASKEGYPANPEPYGGQMDQWLWFRHLWDGIYPEQTFKANPWVWVIEFKRLEGA